MIGSVCDVVLNEDAVLGTCADKPNGPLAFGQDAAPREDGDLWVAVDVLHGRCQLGLACSAPQSTYMIGSPHPETLEVSARLLRQVQTQEGGRARGRVVAALRALSVLQVSSLCCKIVSPPLHVRTQRRTSTDADEGVPGACHALTPGRVMDVPFDDDSTASGSARREQHVGDLDDASRSCVADANDHLRAAGVRESRTSAHDGAPSLADDLRASGDCDGRADQVLKTVRT